MNNKSMKLNVMIRLAAIFLCLVLFTTYLTFGLYAKYLSRAASNGTARVATFEIETDLDRVALGTESAPTLLLGGEDMVQSVSLPFYISSGSEVSAGYSVKIDFDYALPSYLIITLADGTKTETLLADGTQREFVFDDFGTLAKGADETQRADLRLTFSVSDLTMITDEVSIPTAKLTVRVYQVD